MKCLDCLKKHQNLVCYAGGLLTVYVGKKLLASEKLRAACVSGLAKGMMLQRQAESCLQSIKDEAEDLCYDAAAEATAQEQAVE